MYLQVFRIFHMQLQELEVTATRPCDTLAQLLLLWIKASVTTGNLLLALGKLAELYAYMVVWFIPFPCCSRGRLSATDHFLCFSIIYLQNGQKSTCLPTQLCSGLCGCLCGLGWAAQVPAWV